MRRWVLAGLVTVGLVGIGAAAGSAQAAKTAAEGTAAALPRAAVLAAGERICKIKDDEVDEASGLAATASGYVVVEESSAVNQRHRIVLLDDDCKVKDTVSYPRTPRDPEDLAVSPDGKTLWIADIGDDSKDRSTIAVWTMPASGSGKLVIHRLSYPDGAARNAEALLIDGDGLPIIITREAKAGIYKPSAALKNNNTTPVPLRKVADMPALPKTTTPNEFGAAGRTVITGGATAPGGGKVVLRTYADAFEWDVTGGDVTAALISGKPRITALPDEPAGEAITYSADGTKLLTVSQTAQLSASQSAEILSYTPSTETATSKASGNGSGTAEQSKQPAWYNRLSLRDYTYMIGAVGVLGMILVVAGVVGIVRARRRPSAPAVAPVSPPVGPVDRAAEAEPDNTPTAVMTVVREEPVYSGPPPRRDEMPRRDQGPVYGGGRTYQGGGGQRPGPPDPAAAPDRRPGGTTYGQGQGQYRSGSQYESGPRGPAGPPQGHYRSGEYQAGSDGPVYGAPTNGRPQPGYGDGQPQNRY